MCRRRCRTRIRERQLLRVALQEAGVESEVGRASALAGAGLATGGGAIRFGVSREEPGTGANPMREVNVSKHHVLAGGVAAVAVMVTATAFAAGGPMMMGPSHRMSQPSFLGYYDGHKDTYLSTDISSKAEAKMMHINYSAGIGRVKGLPEIYLVQGRAAPGQLAVFGSEPGEPDYSPLWAETILTWKAGSNPVLITSDNQIDQLEKTSGLTERSSHVVLNC